MSKSTFSFRSLRFLVTLAVLTLACVAVVSAYYRSRVRMYSDHALSAAFYVWQEAWSDDVSMAVSRAAPRSDAFMIFAAEIKPEGKELRLVRKRPNWKALADAGRAVILTVRMGIKFADHLKSVGPGPVTRDLAAISRELMEHAVSLGVRPSGVQWDYDCPTSSLGDYAALLKNLRVVEPEIEFSITALPDWLANHEFKRLAQTVPWYVLQVHGLDLPQTISDPVQICRSDCVRPWVEKANQVGVPFWIALPTYTHRLYFDTTGRCLGIASEGAPKGRGNRTRDVRSDPAEMLGILRDLDLHTPRHLLGVVWFRLPVTTDRMNWSWIEMMAVLDRREPEVHVAAEVRSPKPNLYEVWVVNRGERNIAEHVMIPVSWSGSPPLAWDALGDFQVASRMAMLSGSPPRPGTEKLVAWYRMPPLNSSIKHPLVVGHPVIEDLDSIPPHIRK